ncbi:PREDICTED: uncharacterized protein C7orf50 homolog [Myotis davidii]|uniref:uncharacterized protein C7orf50 homolog n=1 Tax=Myotis davidii TaxID=225400 RepID=UPI0007674382|nr:PREDICTED: uncharacterized protein C7orf50 homolog [Myotis davidii]
MAAPKRKAPETPGTPEKKNRKLKKPPAPAAPQGSTDARPEESTSPEAELTPEEKRVLERKLKKERRKAERKRLREAAAAMQRPPGQWCRRTPGPCLVLRPRVLSSWAQKRQSWRFQKTRQTWLLLHMYDRDQVPDQHFPTLLAYLEGLRGRARELTVQKAEALMQQLDEAGAGGGPPGSAPHRAVWQLGPLQCPLVQLKS